MTGNKEVRKFFKGVGTTGSGPAFSYLLSPVSCLLTSCLVLTFFVASAPGSDQILPMDGIKKRVWYNTYGSFSSLSSDDSRKEVSADEFGFMVGYDRRVGSYALFGFGLGGNWATAEKKNRSYELEIPSVKGLFHAKFAGNRWYLDINADFGAGQYDEIFRTANDEFRISDWKKQWGIGTEIGAQWERGLTKTEPFLGLRQTILDDGLNNNALTIFSLGCRHNWQFSGPLAVIKPGFFGGYVHQFDDDLFAASCWMPCATVYRIPDVTMPQDRVFVGMNLTMSMRKSLDIYGKFCSDFASDYSSYSIFAGMNWNF